MTDNFDLNTEEGRKGYDDVLKERAKLYKKQQELIDEIGKLDSELHKYSFLT